VVEAVAKDLRIYVVVDKSGSMEGAIERAKACLAKMVSAIPLGKLHVSLFNTEGRELKITTASSAGVAQAFRGHTAGGGTSYAAGVGVLIAQYKPKDTEDALFLFVGDQADSAGAMGVDHLASVFEQYGVKPAAFGMLHIGSGQFYSGTVVYDAAARLGIPCFPIDEQIFSDPYAVSRTLRNLISATPVGKTTGPAPVAKKRVSLIETILKTPLLQKPVWA
jgi:hypothetical protein